MSEVCQNTRNTKDAPSEGLEKREDATLQQPEGQSEPPKRDVDHLYTMLKPLHNLPRGKNTWDPKFIKIWWFWPASVAFLLVLYYVYPWIQSLFSSAP